MPRRLFPLFDKKRLNRTRPALPEGNPTVADDISAAPAGVGVPHCVAGRDALTRPGKLTAQEEQQIYQSSPSILDFLPWAEYLDRDQCVLLDDGISVGAVYAITPAASEGRTPERLEHIRDTVEDALQDSFDEYDDNPWVVQFFCQDEDNVDAVTDHLKAYVKPHARGSTFSEAWLAVTERHLRGIARPEGLFTDTLITGQPWRGQQRRTRMVIYRHISSAQRDPMSPVAMLNQVGERVTGALAGAGILSVRQSGAQVHDWLLRHFNPSPQWIDKQTLYRDARYFDERDTPDETMR